MKRQTYRVEHNTLLPPARYDPSSIEHYAPTLETLWAIFLALVFVCLIIAGIKGLL